MTGTDTAGQYPEDIAMVREFGLDPMESLLACTRNAAEPLGLVIDGSIRDIAEIRELGWPVFCRNVVPRGSHKGFGGVIDGTATTASCGIAGSERSSRLGPVASWSAGRGAAIPPRGSPAYQV